MRRPDRIFITIVCAFAIGIVVIPMAMLFVGPSIEAGGLDLSFVISVFGQHRLVGALTNTIEASAATALIALVVGVMLAFLVARTDMPLRRTIAGAVVASFITSSYLMAFAYVVLLGPNAGVINQALMTLLGLKAAPFNIYCLEGYVFVATLEAVPLVFLMSIAAFGALDGSLENSARIVGAGRMRVVATITLPMIAPSIGAGALLAFISTLSLYGAPAILGIRVVPTEIQALLGAERFDLAAGISLYLMLLAIVGLLIYRRLVSRGDRFVAITGKWGPAEPFPLGWLRWPLFVLAAAYVVLALVLPYGVLGYASLSKAVGATPSLGNITLANYAFVVHDSLTLRGFRNSFVLSLGAALVATGCAMIIAFLETRFRDRRSVMLMDAIVMIPFGVPSVVIAVGLILAFIRKPFPLYGTIWIIGLAYLVKFLPIAIRTLAAIFEQIDGSLEEASRIAGASPACTFCRITIPLAWGGVVSAIVLVFIPCFRELGASILLASPYNETAAFALITAWGGISFEVTCAIGVAMLALTLLVQLALGRVRRSVLG